MGFNLKLFRARRLRQGLWAGLAGLALLPALAAAQSPYEGLPAKGRHLSAFTLAANTPTTLNVNQFQCGLLSTGPVCADPTSNPNLSGAFWPTGSANGQMYSAGVQIQGFTPMDANCSTTSRLTSNTPTCFPWSGDTAGAVFYGFGGGAPHGTPLTQIYNSQIPADFAAWPSAGALPDFPDVTAFVTDTSMFADVLIGSKAASQQDTWVAYWDGDPARTSGRTHPMGILVEQRTMAWNYPSGNEATVFFVWRMTNVTNNSLFQSLNENRFFGGADRLPNGGWQYDSVWFAFDSDPDVTNNSGSNYATGIFPFNISLAYESSFTDPEYSYPKALFHSPFYENAPAITGMKYLRSPINKATGQELGMSSLSMHTNGGAFRDPGNVRQNWRYVSLNVDASKGDPSCNVGTPAQVKAARSCFLSQTPADVRIFMGSGPFQLDPGQTVTISVAMMAAAVTAIPTYVPGSDAKPGTPTLKPGCQGEPVRLIEQLAGWISSGSCTLDATGLLIQDSVKVVRGSLLGKALVAQTVFDNKFLLGFAPESPNFYLVPGTDKVTVVWSPSATETTGDPFFAAAGDPSNALFDANYRQFDLEGYRIFRGTSPSNMELIAQFDKQGTTFTDKLCVTDPEFITGSPCTATHTVDISSPFVQYTNIAALSDNSPIVIKADTALADEISRGVAQPLTNTGIPFVYEDKSVHNGFTYYYQVRAFDINTVLAGPSSLESASITKAVLVRSPANGFGSAAYSLGVFGRDKQIETCATGFGACTPTLITTPQTIDPVTGVFNHAAQPTNQVSMDFSVAAPQLLPTQKIVAKIDSIVPGYYAGGAFAGAPPAFVTRYYMDLNGTKQTGEISGVVANAGSDRQTIEFSVPIASDPTLLADLRSKGVVDAAPPTAGSLTIRLSEVRPVWSSGNVKWAQKNSGFWNVPVPTNNWVGGSRWFTGANNTQANPTDSIYKHGQLPGMVIFQPTPYADVATPAATPGAVGRKMDSYVFPVGTISATATSTQSDQIFRRFYGTTFGAMRQADIKVFWGAAGVDSVVDVTHNVVVPFSPAIRGSYGFLQDADGNGVLNYGDFYYIPGMEIAGTVFGAARNRPKPLVAQPVVMNTDIDGNFTNGTNGGDGQGFGLYIAGEPFLFNGAVPTNTVWTLRSYNGDMAISAAKVYSYSEVARNATVPGLEFGVNITGAEALNAANVDLKKVHTVPDPYYGVSLYDYGPAIKELQFVNLPTTATIRIYSLSGVLVTVLNHNDPSGGGNQSWNLRNRSNQFVASGVYLFHVSTPDGKEAVGKFTVINQGS
jgi:hypothetical protein